VTVVDAGPTLGPVLEQLSAALDEQHVPGLELAVVRDGAALFAGGLGLRGVDDPVEVGAATLFHHGSCGKAYTGLLAAVLADAGLLDLDAPVRDYVPELRLPDPVIAERVTTRDLLSHRSGLGRHDLAWILNGSWTREEVVRRTAHLPLAGDLRAQCSYSNLGFTLAGLVIERAVGRTWEDQLSARVLVPAGMARTFTRLEPVLDDVDHARAHLLRSEAAVETPWRRLDGPAPAGQLVSCADDSIRWLLLQLGSGAIDAEVIRRTHEVQIPFGTQFPFPELRIEGYAFGWVIGSYRRRPLVWHNGGIDGFATHTMLLPEDGIGVVSSVNLHGSPLAMVAALLVCDALLGETCEPSWQARVMSPSPAPVPPADGAESAGAPQPRSAEKAPYAHRLEDYAGAYAHPGYGDLSVAVEDGALAFRIGDYAVGSQHRHFETWELRYDALDADGTATFSADAAGAIDGVAVRFDDGDDDKPVLFAKQEDTDS
jgi:CubicO group peptidase (beta-lactamase class C family)